MRGAKDGIALDRSRLDGPATARPGGEGGAARGRGTGTAAVLLSIGETVLLHPLSTLLLRSLLKGEGVQQNYSLVSTARFYQRVEPEHATAEEVDKVRLRDTCHLSIPV